MIATNEQLAVMYVNETTEELKALLASYEATIEECTAIGKAWALDSREMRIAESNSSYVRAEIRRRETGDCNVKSSQVGEAVYRYIKNTEGK